MNDVVAVGVFEREADVLNDLQRVGQGQGHQRSKRVAFDQLHDDEGRAINFTGIVYGYDVRMIELGDGLGFAQEARAALRAEFGVAQHFNRYVTIEELIVRAINCAHAAVAEFGVEAIALIEKCADHG